MLSIAKLGPGGFTYYLETVAAGRARPGGLVEADGQWLGRAAVSLGLAQLPVDAARMRPLLEGVDPVTGDVLDPSHRRVRVSAFDCTFAAPKSVSLVHALGQEHVVAEVRAAHEASVAAALGYLEDAAARVRRRSGGVDRVVPATGLLAATFLHRTSRQPDPHLHSHVVVANLADDGTGRWTALDARQLFVHATTAGVLYRSQLRHEMVRRLDVTWRWRDDGFADLAGVRPEALRAFSRRSETIRAELESVGRSGPRAARIVAARSRAAKELAVPYETLVASWQERAWSVGISSGRIAAVTPGCRTTPAEQGRLSATPMRTVPEVGARPFTRRDLVRARSDSLREGGAVAEVVASVERELQDATASGAILADPDRASAGVALRGARGARIPSGVAETRLVTREFLQLEARVAAQLREATEAPIGPLPPGVFVLSASPKGPLDGAQRLTLSVAEALASGRPIVAVAPSERRSAHLEALTGMSVTRAGDRRPARGELVVVADADHLAVPEMARILADGAALSSTVLVMASADGAGRHVLVAALRRDEPLLEAARAPRSPASITDGRDWRSNVTDGVAVRMTPDARGLVSALLDEHCRQAADLGSSTIVVADGRIADEIERASKATARVVAAGNAPALARGAPGSGLVVLGGARLLGAGAYRDNGVARVHVGVAPIRGAGVASESAGRRDESFGRWASYLATGRQTTRELARSRSDPDRLLGLETRDGGVRGVRGRELGRDLGRSAGR